MRTYLALGIAVLWAVSYFASLISMDYTGFELVTPVMVIAATYLLSTDLLRRGKNGT